MAAAVIGAGLWPDGSPLKPARGTLDARSPAPPPRAVDISRLMQATPLEPPEEPRRSVRIDRNAATPTSVVVPAVGISARVIPLGLRENGSLEVPRDFSKAGWRRGGPEPGERGAAVIVGHVDSKTGPAAFYRLREMTRGHKIRVRREDRTTVTFVVRRTEQVAKVDFPTRRVYGKTRLPTLRLVTCDGGFDAGSGHYRDNLIVYATRVAS